MFSYNEAFSRNIGWITVTEQEILRTKRIAIAGLGGVGGGHLLTLARLGIGAFNIADYDVFDLVNINRQAGATMSSLGRQKVDVLAELARDINPDLDIKAFRQGINKDNLADFLADADLYVDGLDFFAFSTRQDTFSACAEMGIPAITVAPLGMGAALLNFLPGKISFEQYFRLGDQPEAEKALRFMLGLAPARLQLGYLVDPSSVDLAQHRGPSTIMACQLCAGIAASEALKILLKRGNVPAAPHGVHFDAYHNKMARTWRPFGNNNPLQRLALGIARRQLGSKIGAPPSHPDDTKPKTVAEAILDLARWAPSGDNTQPWRFKVVSERHIVVRGFDTREHCVYDLNGHPSQIAIGALLENISIAASGHGLHADIRRRTDTPENKPVFDVHLHEDFAVRPDPLIPFIRSRSVQRRPMRTLPLSRHDKQALEDSAGSDYQILWLEDPWSRLRTAWLNFHVAKLRLTMPEAYQVHRAVIQWNARFSEDRVPDEAVGLDPMTTRLMGWVMQSWKRVEFFNNFLAGTLMPRIQLDFIPGIACAAHFVILARHSPERIDDYTSAGRAVQRFWLTATQLGLQLQPEMAPLIFAGYAREGTRFSDKKGTTEHAHEILEKLDGIVGVNESKRAMFMGRIGAGKTAQARSLRLPLRQLMTE